MEDKQRTIQQNRAETWKDVLDYEEKYQISNYGRIRSLSRMKLTKGRAYYRTKEIIMKPIYKRIGYIQTTLCKNSEPKIFLVHRLVAQHFLENPNNKPQINHIDGNGFNNFIENLEWCSASENGLHSYRVLGNIAWQNGKQGENMPTSRPILQKTLDGKLVKRWGCGLDAVREGGFDSGCICHCCKKESKTHKGYIWEYEK